MRTTLTLDDDLGSRLSTRAHQLGISFQEMVNRTLRTGLGANNDGLSRPVPRTIPHSFGFRPEIDLDKLNQLADDFEVEARA
jgi:hypothetical protein